MDAASDDEAPEELTVQQGKEQQVLQRAGEAASRKQHKHDLRSRREKWAAKSEAPADADELPEELLAAVAESRSRQQSAAAAPRASTAAGTAGQRKAKQPAAAAKRKPVTQVQKGPVVVKVLKRLAVPTKSDAAKAFLQGQLYGSRLQRKQPATTTATFAARTT